MKLKKIVTFSKLIFIVGVPILLLILPATFFDDGQSLCLSQLIFNFECYGCGMTRGIMHLIHFNIEEAFDYNMLSFIVLPLLGIIWMQWFFKELKLLKRINSHSS
ncbi:MAG: DUF2752 domain-containing protein [Ginsengibacter sp.]